MARSINNLREQLLKAGLVTADEIARVEEERKRPPASSGKRRGDKAGGASRREGQAPRGRRKGGGGRKPARGESAEHRPGSTQRQSGGRPAPVRGRDEQAVSARNGETGAKQQQAAPARRRKRSRGRKRAVVAENVRAKIVRHCQAELIRLQPGSAVFNYVLPNSPRVRRVEMAEAQQQALVSGECALVAINSDVRFALRSKEAPKTFGRRAKRYYTGGPATSTKAPDDGDLGLMKAAAARELRSMDPRLVLYLREESGKGQAEADAPAAETAAERSVPEAEVTASATVAAPAVSASESDVETAEENPAVEQKPASSTTEGVPAGVPELAAAAVQDAPEPVAAEAVAEPAAAVPVEPATAESDPGPGNTF